MKTTLDKAKKILLDNDYTCVLFDGENIYHSNQRGVKPLLEFLNMSIDFSNYCVADKVIGAGAAHIYVLLGVKTVWTNVISNTAKEVLERNNIAVFFNTKVSHIINRAGDGMCPIEKCVKGITDPNTALVAIEKQLQELA